MSSVVDSGGTIAAAVVMPVAVAFGAGWLAWQGGKLLFEANEAVNRQVIEKKRELADKESSRKKTALAAHKQLVDACMQVIFNLEKEIKNSNLSNIVELEKLKVELQSICTTQIPDDLLKIESITTYGYLQLEKIIASKKHLSNLTINDDATSEYYGLSLADLMDDISITLSAMKIQETKGIDIEAIDPVVYERASLNERLYETATRINDSLKFIAELTVKYGLSESGSRYLHSCFDGIDEQIQKLFMPSISNNDLKSGIKRLDNMLDQYELLIPTIEAEQKKICTLYKIYLNASKALDEPIVNISSFKNSSEIEDRLLVLKERSKRAEDCAKIYNRLGSRAYICYAWDQELKALGYTVHTKNEIETIANSNPVHAKKGNTNLPFYYWSEKDLTQLYSMSSECSLQLIVHDDNTITMQSISDSDDSMAIKETQKLHCSSLRKLHENLKKNWFLSYDYNEKSSFENVVSAEECLRSDKSLWETREVLDNDVERVNRTDKKSSVQKMKR